VGTPRRSTYSASKHALQGYFDSLRAEVHDLGVHVTLLCPGFIKTDLTHSALTGDGSTYGDKPDAVKRSAITPEECASQMVEAIEKDATEILIGGKELSAAYLKRVSPGLLAKVIRRVKSS
jgi:short-subunit dehydrogenase